MQRLIVLGAVGTLQIIQHLFEQDRVTHTIELAVLDLGRPDIQMSSEILGNPDQEFPVNQMSPRT